MCHKVRQDSRKTSSKHGKSVFVLCEDFEAMGSVLEDLKADQLIKPGRTFKIDY